ncbi:hypothetical protein IWX47DRAFT_535834 [Phyllosticta citricarpa]
MSLSEVVSELVGWSVWGRIEKSISSFPFFFLIHLLISSSLVFPFSSSSSSLTQVFWCLCFFFFPSFLISFLACCHRPS